MSMNSIGGPSVSNHLTLEHTCVAFNALYKPQLLSRQGEPYVKDAILKLKPRGWEEVSHVKRGEWS